MKVAHGARRETPAIPSFIEIRCPNAAFRRARQLLQLPLLLLLLLLLLLSRNYHVTAAARAAQLSFCAVVASTSSILLALVFAYGFAYTAVAHVRILA